MRRYWVEPDCIDSATVGGRVHLSGETLHHIRDVCRQTKGDRFEVLIDGRALLVEIIDESKRESIASVLEVREIPGLPFPRVRLALAIPRFGVFESILEKCVELGVEAVQPLFTDNSFIRTQSDVWSSKVARFQKIVQGATQQCGRGERMDLAAPLKLPTFLTELKESANRGSQVGGLFAYEGGHGIESQPIRKALENLKGAEYRALWLFVGGEGGFSQSEVALFAKSGYAPTTLGGQVLRVETACVALVSVLKYEWNLMA